MTLDPVTVTTNAEFAADLVAPPAMIRDLINRHAAEIDMLTRLLEISEKAIDNKTKKPKNSAKAVLQWK